ncbi:E3 SUMO-protein ligase ZBED1-like [Diretmus argenteus]
MMYHIKAKHPGVMSDSSQPKITSLLPGGRRCDARRSEAITQLVSTMIETDMRPISVVEGEGFKQLIQYLEPEYVMPSRATIIKRIVKRFEEKKDALKVKLARADKLALTTDCWTALTNESYMTTTCHFIDADWEIQSSVLLTQSISVRHTSDNLAEKLTSTVETWGISGRVLACVHDNAKNIVGANSPTRLPWDSVPCYAHTLQLAINDGFNVYVCRVIVAAGRLVKHFSHSHPATVALKAKQAIMQLPQHRLIQSTKTRWNSVCDMFDRLVEQRWALSAVLSDRNVTKLQDARTLELQDDYWQIMTEILPVLATLKCVTTVMSLENDVSISNTYPITFSLLEKHLLRAEDDSRRVTEFKAKVRESLRKRMQVDTENLMSLPPLIASMLDPRHKHLRCLPPVKRERANTHLLALARSVDLASISLETSAASASTSETEQPAAASSAMLLLLGGDYHGQTHEEGEADSEVGRYLREVSPSLENHPLHWWKANEERFPRLAILSKRYLAIPGTSVPSERVFSAAGLTVNRLRSRLTPDHVNMLIFLNKNR